MGPRGAARGAMPGCDNEAMRKILTPAQMAAADRATAAAGTPSLELMERAGRAVAQAALGLAGGAYGRRIVVVSGKGNNAGDGFVAARHLHRAGAHPVVVMTAGPGDLSRDARVNYERLGTIRTVGFSPSTLRRELTRAQAAVDALVGTGFRGALEGSIADAAIIFNESHLPVVAVDVPSGVDAETGAVETEAVEATLTITMGALKRGLVLWPGSAYAGEVEIADLGIPTEDMQTDLYLVAAGDVKDALGRRDPTSDKRSVGTVLVVAGSVGMSGAAALVARGALRAGAGLVTTAAPRSVAVGLHQVVSEGTTLPLPETDRGSIASDALPVALEHAGKFDAIAIGPGLSRHSETEDFIRKFVTQAGRPMVIDADALNAFEKDPEALSARSAPTVLTPHVRELGRLLGLPEEEISQDRLGAAAQAARRADAVVLLKGYRTVVAEESGLTFVVATGGPVLATGGSGDVLTGIIAALLAGNRGTRPAEAAWAGAWIHGRCGDLWAGLRGDRGIVATDLTDLLPEVIRLAGEEA